LAWLPTAEIVRLYRQRMQILARLAQGRAAALHPAFSP
jgi:hypothetical protein